MSRPTSASASRGRGGATATSTSTPTTIRKPSTENGNNSAANSPKKKPVGKTAATSTTIFKRRESMTGNNENKEKDKDKDKDKDKLTITTTATETNNQNPSKTNNKNSTSATSSSSTSTAASTSTSTTSKSTSKPVSSINTSTIKPINTKSGSNPNSARRTGGEAKHSRDSSTASITAPNIVASPEEIAAEKKQQEAALASARRQQEAEKLAKEKLAAQLEAEAKIAAAKAAQQAELEQQRKKEEAARQEELAAEKEKQAKKAEERKKKRTQVINEILETERIYCESINHVVNEFENPMKKMATEGAVKPATVKGLFSNMESIASFHGVLHAELAKSAQSTTGFAQVFLKYADFLKMYTQYVNGWETTLQAFNEVADNKKVQKFLAEKRKEGGLDLMSYLIMPVQRIPRYELLLKELKRNLDSVCVGPLPDDGVAKDDPNLAEAAQELAVLDDALSKIQSIALHVNETKRKTERVDQLLQLSRKITHLEGPLKEGLVDKTRQLIRQGELGTKGTRKKLKHFFLFNDYLIWTNSSFKAKGQMLLSAAQIHDKNKDSNDDTTFEILHPQHKPLQLVAETAAEKHAWMNALNDSITEARRMELEMINIGSPQEVERRRASGGDRIHVTGENSKDSNGNLRVTNGHRHNLSTDSELSTGSDVGMIPPSTSTTPAELRIHSIDQSPSSSSTTSSTSGIEPSPQLQQRHITLPTRSRTNSTNTAPVPTATTTTTPATEPTTTSTTAPATAANGTNGTNITPQITPQQTPVPTPAPTPKADAVPTSIPAPATNSRPTTPQPSTLAPSDAIRRGSSPALTPSAATATAGSRSNSFSLQSPSPDQGPRSRSSSTNSIFDPTHVPIIHQYTEPDDGVFDFDRELAIAADAMSKIPRNEVTALKMMKKPPVGVKLAIESIAVLMGLPPVELGGNKVDYWKPVQALLVKPTFLKMLVDFNAAAAPLSPETIARLKKYIDNPLTELSSVSTGSKPAGIVWNWVRHYYAKQTGKQPPAPRPVQALSAEEQAAKYKSHRAQMSGPSSTSASQPSTQPSSPRENDNDKKQPVTDTTSSNKVVATPRTAAGRQSMAPPASRPSTAGQRPKSAARQSMAPATSRPSNAAPEKKESATSKAATATVTSRPSTARKSVAPAGAKK